ncbi:hypothetical protein H0G86_002806 [Trichoderma simmonsii]|uniref:Uncharacterized protein n=1 Tax=Trichoderma simmonsii TaxID=1491479 RepID=A0A8G0L9A7_9HYPO|nr:hypothetical protein H0G86_002806 [Trichoderma simmonsii]
MSVVMGIFFSYLTLYLDSNSRQDAENMKSVNHSSADSFAHRSAGMYCLVSALHKRPRVEWNQEYISKISCSAYRCMKIIMEYYKSENRHPGVLGRITPAG